MINRHWKNQLVIIRAAWRKGSASGSRSEGPFSHPTGDIFQTTIPYIRVSEIVDERPFVHELLWSNGTTSVAIYEARVSFPGQPIFMGCQQSMSTAHI
jgi:hypothetical protein